jgi:hypothetical protein
MNKSLRALSVFALVALTAKLSVNSVFQLRNEPHDRYVAQ